MERFAQLGADIVKLWEQCGSDYLRDCAKPRYQR